MAHRITGFEPASPLLSAGVSAGDLIVDPPRGRFLAGETVKLQIAHERMVRTVEVRAARIDRLSAPVENALDFGLDILVLVLGLTIALRRRRDLGALVLAVVFFLAVGGLLPSAFPAGRLAGSFDLWQSICMLSSLPILAYFSLVFEGGYRSRARPWISRAIVGLGAAVGVWVVIAAPYYRLRWLFVGFALTLANFCVLAAFSYGAFSYTSVAVLVINVVTDSVVTITLLILTYAILRHRVIDVGFAINRALVFAAFTGLLLVSFGIVEWLVDHFVRFENRESGVLLDGIIALALASAALALPMVRRSELVGLLAVGKKIEREVYRPDEIDNLARAVRQVGFDLYALRLEQLEQRRLELQQQNEGLRQGLRSLLQPLPANPPMSNAPVIDS